MPGATPLRHIQLPEPESLSLAQTLFAIAQASTWAGARTIIEHHPEVLSTAADDVLMDFSAAARRQHHDDAASVLDQVHAYLVRCRALRRTATGEAKARLGASDGDPFTRIEGKQLGRKIPLVLPEFHSLVTASLQAFEAQRRYARSDDIRDLDAAVATWKAITTNPSFTAAPTGWRLEALNSAGNAALQLYDPLSRRESLDNAAAWYQEAIREAPTDWPGRHRYVYNLARAVEQYYSGRGGRSVDLERARDLCEEAIRTAPLDSPYVPRYLLFLGNLLWEIYRTTGVISHLDQSIAAMEESIRRLPPDDVALPVYLHQLGIGYRKRFLRTQELADLDRAIDLEESAIRLKQPDRMLGIRLDDLGNGLLDRYYAAHRNDDLARAISLHRRAVRLSRPDSPFLPNHLNNLGNALSARFERTHGLKDMDEAIDLYKRAIELAPPRSTILPSREYNLGNALRGRFDQTHASVDLTGAIEAYRNATTRGLDVDLEWALGAARNWGDWASEREAWEEAAEAYQYGLQALERLFAAQLLRENKEAWLSAAPALATQAAYALARLGDLAGAIVTLEHGRARLVSESLERTSSDLARLSALGYSDTLEQYQRAARRWDELTGTVPSPGQVPAGTARTGREVLIPENLEDVRTELDAAIDAIRRVPGFEHFLAPLSFEEIRAAVDIAPVVFVVAAESGGLALILGPDNAAVTPLWLPELTADELRQKVDAYYREGYLRRHESPGGLERWHDALDAVAQWLWPAVMEPLVAALRPATRVILIASGLLGVLPLHAAWTEGAETSLGRRYALDELAVTYAPNAHVLLAARNRAARVPPNALFAVDQPLPVHAEELPNAKFEAEIATATFGRQRVLHHEAATREEVLGALPEYAVMHLCCHGYANLARPLEGGLVMAHDEVLSLRDLLELRLPGVCLAILSACETGLPGAELPDEVVSLPTGLLQAQVAGVVGTLWSVTDQSTLVLMARYYELWREDGLMPPEALRTAQIWVRDATNREIGDHFRTRLPEFGGKGAPYAAASALYQAFAFLPQDDRALAHPYYWAAFGYFGR